MSISPDDFAALTFDCYGTLIDWETGLLAQLRAWSERNRINVSDAELLAAFAEAEPRCEHARPTAPYRDILRDVHGELARAFGVTPNAAQAGAIAMSVGDWPPFPDTVEALSRLKRKYRLIVVSNVDKVSFARTATKLGDPFDAVVTAEEVGAYKPDPRMFLRAFEVAATLGVDRSRILHVAQSLYHDHEPAKSLAMKTALIRRRGPTGATRPPTSTVTPDLTFDTLDELADWVDTHRSPRI